MACRDVELATDMISAGLVAMLAKSMNSLTENIDTAKPLTRYGVDSLIAVGLRTWIFKNCGVQVSVFEILSDQSINETANMIATKGGFGKQGDN
jgi:acyl carrier protein